MEDITLKCLCGRDFTFTKGEQEFYSGKGYTPPKRCEECRAKKRADRIARDVDASLNNPNVY